MPNAPYKGALHFYQKLHGTFASQKVKWFDVTADIINVLNSYALLRSIEKQIAGTYSFPKVCFDAIFRKEDLAKGTKKGKVSVVSSQ